jgi:AcrR family transcriptional regulator
MMALAKDSEKKQKPRGRPTSFDRDEMVEQIMHLFWESGFRALSFNEIAKETGLTRASLYNAFESKEALLLEALKHYFKGSPDAILDTIKEGDPVGPVFYRMFNHACKVWASDDKHRGCLAVNCLNELMAGGSDLSWTLKDMFEQRRVLIIKLMKQAIKRKELPPKTDPDVTGNMVLAFMEGISTFSKNGISETELRKMCHAFLEQVGFKND